MKKRIFALLLAGVMTVSMASCVSKPDDDPDKTEGSTGTVQTLSPSATIAGVTFTPVNQTVYTIVENAKLYTDVTDTKNAVTVENKMTEMTRIKTSTKWSVVEYKNAQYYVETKSLTADDLLGKNFTACLPKTMYVTTSVNMRTYASADNNISPVVKLLAKGEEVTVIASGKPSADSNDLWYKLNYTTESNQVKNYFVHSSYIGESKDSSTSAATGGGTLPANYENYFDGVTPSKMYVCTSEYPNGNVNLRSQPIVSGDTWRKTVKDGTEVTVIAMGTGAYEGWCKIKVAREKNDPNEPQFYDEYYVGYSNLSEFKSGSATTLAEILEKYTGLTAVTKTMYVSTTANNGLNVRATPDFNNGRIIKGLQAKDTVKIVAQGMQGDVFCYVVEFTENETATYGFVSAKYITPDVNGAPVLTLDELLAENAGFTKLSAEKVCISKANTACSMTLPWATSRTLAEGVEVTVVASGTSDGAELYIALVEGNYYFIASESLTEKAA